MDPDGPGKLSTHCSGRRRRPTSCYPQSSGRRGSTPVGGTTSRADPRDGRSPYSSCIGEGIRGPRTPFREVVQGWTGVSSRPISLFIYRGGRVGVLYPRVKPPSSHPRYLSTTTQVNGNELTTHRFTGSHSVQ